MNIFDQLLADNQIPKFVRVRHEMDRGHIDDIEGAVAQAMQREGTLDRIKPGDSVCITAGSRDVANIARVIRAICDQVKSVGAHPFIIPAMGSHAGAKAEGQRGIIEGYGVTEEAMGAPIRATMDTEVIAHSKSGLEIHLDKYANAADFLIPVGRIKAHTDFRGEVESGICKMLVIGMGKQHGAYQCHKLGFKSMAANVKEFAGAIIEKKPNMFAIGLIENAYHQTCRIEAIPAGRILEEEPPLLDYAKSRMAKIPFDQADILFVDETGKDISGAGMDPNVTGRSAQNGISRPFAERIVARDLTDEAHHNATGMGNADVTTRRLFDKIDMEQTYPNSLTSRDINGFRIPIVMENDNLAIRFALHTITGANAGSGYRAMWIRDTNHVQTFYVTERLLADTAAMPWLRTDGVALRPVFGADGYFTGWERA